MNEPATVTLTDSQRQTFLDLLRETRTIGTVAALRQAGLEGTRGQLRTIVKDDPDLAAEAREARGYGDQAIRSELARRAIDGVEEDVFGSLGGNAGTGVIGRRRVYSDRLLGLMARAHLPEYRDTGRLEIVGDTDRPLVVAHERRLTLGDLFAYAAQHGLDDGSSGQLPAAPPVLAAPSVDQSAAGELPPRPT